jgi:CCR4-NOT transcription complex subunit 7/8
VLLGDDPTRVATTTDAAMFPIPPPVIPAPATVVGRLQIVSVGASNYIEELNRIGFLLQMFPYVAIDTEYPGTLHGAPAGPALTTAARYYAFVKANVDELPALQLGLTLCDEGGKLPEAIDDQGGSLQLAWEFNFSDFDIARGRHAPESVRFLMSQGFHFDVAREYGVPSAYFADWLAGVLARLPHWCQPPTWVAFGGAFDFAYMVKMLSGGQPLPDTPEELVARARYLLRGSVFDAKCMAEHCGRPELCGAGLRTVAAVLGVPQLHPAPPRLAGPKSHAACRIYSVMRTTLVHGGVGYAYAYEGLIDGIY